MDDHLVPLARDWALRREFAVRSAGFPVSGLDVFGAQDESGRLREVAADPAFREALTWQNAARSRLPPTACSTTGSSRAGGASARRS
jgi:hypothetical protein